MTGIVAVTAAPALREQLVECAVRAGVHLLQHDGVAAARPACKQADVVLLGADLTWAAVRGRLSVRGEVVVIGTGTLAADAFHAAGLLHATYVAALPGGRDWLVDRLRPAGDQRIGRLRTAGFAVGYAGRDRAWDDGFVRPLDCSHYPDEQRPHPFVSFADIARGEDRAGQSSTVQRSNLRGLHRAFAGVFTDLVFPDVAVLGAFVGDLSDDVVDVVCRLATEYLVFDEDDLSALETEEIHASWGQWLAHDVCRGLGENATAVWDALDDEERERLWWQTVTGLNAWPEHDGRSPRWRLGRLTPAYAARLTAERRRRHAAAARRAAAAVR